MSGVFCDCGLLSHSYRDGGVLTEKQRVGGTGDPAVGEEELVGGLSQQQQHSWRQQTPQDLGEVMSVTGGATRFSNLLIL